MVFENIEKLKQEFTDKFVVVDLNRPELRRFGGQTGQVKTVNMSGRALVEFDGFANIGWYDIALDYLTVVDKPLPKEPEKKAPPKKAPPKQEKQAAKPTAKAASPPKEPAGGKMSVAEMLAAARGEKSGGAAATSATQTEPKPSAPAKESQAAAPAKDPQQMSVAEMLAAARAEKSGSGTAPAAAVESTPEQPQAVSEQSAPEVPAEHTDETPAPTGELPTETAEILAWCRQHDGS